MSRLVTAALTVALAVYSCVQVKTSLPLLTARILTHSGSTEPVREVIGAELSFSLFLQLFLAALLLGVPYIAAENIHFGSWCLSRYTPEQRDRILPVLRELTGLLALLVSFYFAARIYLRIHEARSHGPLLPADWPDHCRFSEGRDPGFSKPFPPDFLSHLMRGVCPNGRPDV
jgi:hypothetical protein